MADDTSETIPNCYNCVHLRTVPGDCHISCANLSAKAVGSHIGIKHGWFLWPFNFDPTWLLSCSGFAERNERK